MSSRRPGGWVGSDTADTVKDDPLLGRILDGRFQVQSLLAIGGMGRIYKGMQLPDRRTVAIKILRLDKAGEQAATFRQRFFREASMGAQLRHPNSVRIQDYGQTGDGIYYLVMEYLSGPTLRQFAGNKPIPPQQAVTLMLQICGAVAEAHKRGLLHRDLKPSNIIIETLRDGHKNAHVVDFGLVKHVETEADETGATEQGFLVGSPAYMAPEQILQRPLTAQSDVYSLGVMMYAMFTGRRPFYEESIEAIVRRHLTTKAPTFQEIAPHLDLPAPLEWVTLQCLHKEPHRRFNNAGELANALRLCQASLTPANGPGPSVPLLESLLVNGVMQLPSNLAKFATLTPEDQTTVSSPKPGLPASDTTPKTASASDTRLRLRWLTLVLFAGAGLLVLGGLCLATSVCALALALVVYGST